MRRKGCDIYGYPVYEREERLFIIASADGSKSVRVIAKDVREAGEIFGEMIELATKDGIWIREVN